MGGSSGSRIGHLDRQEGEVLYFHSTSKAGRGTPERVYGKIPYITVYADDGDGYLTVGQSYIPLGQRGVGHGTGMYLAIMKEAKKQGLGFRSDQAIVSGDGGDEPGTASKVWRSLKAKGVKMTSRKTPLGYVAYSVSAEEVQRWGTRAMPWSSLESKKKGKKRRGSAKRYRKGAAGGQYD